MQVESFIRAGYFCAIREFPVEVPRRSPDGETYRGVRSVTAYNGYLCVPPTHPLAECGDDYWAIPDAISNAVTDGISYARLSGDANSAVATPMQMYCIGFSTMSQATQAAVAEGHLEQLAYKLYKSPYEEAARMFRTTGDRLLAQLRDRVEQEIRDAGKDESLIDLYCAVPPTRGQVRRELRSLGDAVTEHYR